MSYDKESGIYTGYIYCITNKINGKQYIGQTSRTVEKRFREHVNLNHNSAIHNAIKKYGEEYFSFDILSQVESMSLDDLLSKLNDLEIKFIDKYRSRVPLGYNRSIGGDNGSLGCHWKMSDEQKALLSKIHTGMKCSEETKQKIRLSKIGTKLSEHTKEILLKSHLNIAQTEETKEKIREWHLGRKKQYVSECNKINKSKPICQFDLHGQFIKSYYSARYAGSILNISPTGISKCCNGHIKCYCGFMWKYDDGVRSIRVSEDEYIEMLRCTRHRKIIQLTLDGDKLNVYATAREAGKLNGISPSGIYNCCIGEFKQFKGYLWKYLDPKYDDLTRV